MIRTGRTGWLLLALTASLLLAGCDRGQIWTITVDPGAYRGQTVTVEGVVTAQMQVPDIGWNYYQISDDQGAGLWVQTRRDPPPIETLQKVTGIVRTGISLRGNDFPVLLDATSFE